MADKKKYGDKKNNIDKFTQELQEQIMKQIRKTYSDVVIDHWQNPRNYKKIETPDGYASVTGTCGDTMEMFLKMKEDKITDVGFQTDGCGTTITCGSMAAQLTLNKSLAHALATVSADEILKGLGGLPASDVHCAQLASEALRRAFADYIYQKKSPWRKHYRRG